MIYRDENRLWSALDGRRRGLLRIKKYIKEKKVNKSFDKSMEV